ncbi:MAG TPA: DUF2339 domain-containing protein [Sphingomonas sp.]|uniref:DUF2339 domain-containing protein n=1 Tax=Sphingomonas sp. TaxID=28214 RepID=UPI002B770ABD|nr:DUF2339 domain-containing protein [Sphingomonas sp.]HMI21266.1 DUF2339 domain-containing protein [Sphingomonas sp.]
MVMLVLIAMFVLVGYLWRQVQALRERVELLEMAPGWIPVPDQFETIEPAAPPVPLDPEPAMPQPADIPELNAVAEAAPAPRGPIEQAPQPERGWSFEDIFGRRLPIWAGGVTLAVAGFLIVKYSIDAGLLSPITRVIMGLIFGTTLIGAAELALRADEKVRDPRIRQALSGAGIATLFAAILVAVNLYHLIGPMTAFIGMALTTALAIGLSLRFGAPSAILGLIGGLAAPALVGSTQPNIPLLTLYLALTVGGLSSVARHQRWWWLGATALTGGFGWGLLLIFNGLLDLSQTLSVGLYTLALGAALPLLLVGDRAPVVRLAASIAGCAQMAALVALGGFALLDWGLLGLISVAALFLSRREPVLAEVPALALGVAILLAVSWPAPMANALALVLAGIALIHALPAALRVWTPAARSIDAPILAGSALAIAILPAFHFPHVAPLLRAWPALAGAVMAAGVAGWGWSDRTRCTGSRFAILAAASAASLGFADAFGLAEWTLPGAVALLALGLQLLGLASANRHVERTAWAFGAASLALLLPNMDEPVNWVAGDWSTFARWAIPAAAAVGLACTAPRRVAQIAQALAVLLFYSACAQVVPGDWLPIVPPLLLASLAATGREKLWPAAAAAAAVAICWAVAPLVEWLFRGGYSALTGEPFYLSGDALWPTLRQLALPALALGLTAIRLPMPQRARIATGIAATLCGMAAAHIAYRHLIVIDSRSDFIARGIMERTLWEMALAIVATAAWALRKPRIALLLGGAALAHFFWFTMLLHNPLWCDQAVGVWLALAYAIAFALVWASDWLLPDIRRPRGWAMMVLIALFAFSLLRQIAHGSMPLRLGVDGTEDIARSVLAIALAVGFLRYGIAKTASDWRLASLGLMLVAVIKVFLFDAAGLDGLLRIGSFAALGVSLIGVGWLYSRYLPDASR